MSFWTLDRVAVLEDRWGKGWSALEISKELGCDCTRNMVIGRADRCKLQRTVDVTAFWNAEDTETLKRLWGAGWPADKIAGELMRTGKNGALTRGSVLQRAKRIGLKPRHRTISFAIRKPKAEHTPAVEYVTPECDLRIPEAQRKTFRELGENDCHWPVGDVGEPDFFFCGGAKLKGRAYCSDHHARSLTYKTPSSFHGPITLAA